MHSRQNETLIRFVAKYFVMKVVYFLKKFECIQEMTRSKINIFELQIEAIFVHIFRGFSTLLYTTTNSYDT